MFDDKEILNFKEKYPNVVFGEDTQTAWGKSPYMDTNVVFTSHPRNNKISPETKDPSEWTGERSGWQNEGYRNCCTSVVWVGEALSARLMRAEKYWNHDPFFAYVDRWMTEDREGIKKALEKGKKILIEKKLLPEWVESGGRNAGKSDESDAGSKRKDPRTDPFSQEMWDTYRNNLPPVLTIKE